MPNKPVIKRKREEPIVPIVPTKVVEPLVEVITQPVEPTRIPLKYPCFELS